MSTGLIGSTLPVACTRTAMSPRVTAAVGSGAGPVVLALHETRTLATDAKRSELRRGNMARKWGGRRYGKLRSNGGPWAEAKRRPRTEAPPRSFISEYAA